MIAGIEIENFTAFGSLQLSLSPRVNVVIGSNGSGKTHLLKAIYGLALAGLPLSADRSEKEVGADISRKLLRLFSPEENKIGTLRASGAKGQTRLSLVSSDDTRVAISFGSRSQSVRIKVDASGTGHELQPVFIPTKEVLSLIRGMRHPDHDRATVEMIFDDGYIDLAELLVHPGFEDEASSLAEDPRLSSIVRELVDLVGGRYRWADGGTFRFEPGRYEEKVDPARSKSKAGQAYQDSTVTRFVTKDGRSLSSSMTAEGYRKIGVLHRLLSNGSINPGDTGVLLWDEPEANLNPKLMKKLVQLLLELSRNGQQIVLATHDYVLLKWFDLLMEKGKEDHVRFHVLVREENGAAIVVHSTDDYDQLVNTGIAKTFSELYDAEIERSLEGVKL
ncbi:AAA family ATPase [Bradyrhizobium sp. CIAT3101]|uniref:AAA family ATPase n=1 Tax=Bradyrhizobium sp. CIAT3101 TaxID=439387 RepID=UPI0024B1E2E8|nr:AAA family ATPase [Bradyrhizobium sp. CIAT3101]WFU81342.1 AAA family ATPase [Bradyrhizobium sp. CIAT3101]